MASFDGLPFGVVPDDQARFPIPSAPDGNAPRTYAITAIVSNPATKGSLRNRKSVVTVLPMMGSASGGTIVIEGGTGVASLVYPDGNGGEDTVDALLTSIAPSAHMLSDTDWLDLVFLIVE